MLCLPFQSKTRNYPKANFQWSLKPIFILAQCCGIPFKETPKDKPKGKGFWIVHTIVFLVGISIFLTQIFKLQLSVMDVKQTIPEDARLAHVSNSVLYTQMHKFLRFCIAFFPNVLQMTTYLALFIFANITSKWSAVWSALEEIQNEFDLNYDFHQKARRKCYIGPLLFFLVNEMLSVLFMAYKHCHLKKVYIVISAANYLSYFICQ